MPSDIEDEDVLLILDMYLGDIISKALKRIGYSVLIDEEYYDLLMFIYNEFCKTWFKDAKPGVSELRKKLIRARRKPGQLEVLISYLVSKYLERNSTTYITG